MDLQQATRNLFKKETYGESCTFPGLWKQWFGALDLLFSVGGLMGPSLSPEVYVPCIPRAESFISPY